MLLAKARVSAKKLIVLSGLVGQGDVFSNGFGAQGRCEEAGDEGEEMVDFYRLKIYTREGLSYSRSSDQAGTMFLLHWGNCQTGKMFSLLPVSVAGLLPTPSALNTSPLTQEA